MNRKVLYNISFIYNWIKLIYITNSKGDGRPCVKVYEGRSIKWYYCESEVDLLNSFINLLKYDKKFLIFNVYGRRIYIPEDPKLFEVREELEEFEGVVYNLTQLLPLIKMCKEIHEYRRRVKVKLKSKVNAEEILKLGIKIINPIELPKLF
jgi:hypothetical protein